jgi:hypothetical protein
VANPVVTGARPDPGSLHQVHPIAEMASSTLPSEQTRSRGQLAYGAAMAVDGDVGTAWAESVTGYGVGEWLELRFGAARSLRLVCVVNGYGLTWDLYERNGRVRDILATTAGGARASRLRDRTESTFRVPQGIEVDTDRTRLLRLTIDSVYAGVRRDRYNDTAVAEVEVYSDD